MNTGSNIPHEWVNPLTTNTLHTAEWQNVTFDDLEKAKAKLESPMLDFEPSKLLIVNKKTHKRLLASSIASTVGLQIIVKPYIKRSYFINWNFEL